MHASVTRVNVEAGHRHAFVTFDPGEEPVVDRLLKEVRLILRMGVSLPVPLLSTILGELLPGVIPDLRSRRFEQNVTLFGERREQLEEEVLRQRFSNPENVDVFEEGAWQSSRAKRLLAIPCQIVTVLP